MYIDGALTKLSSEFVNRGASLSGGYYVALREATSSKAFDAVFYRLTYHVVEKIKLPLKVRKKYVSDFMAMREERFSEPLSKAVVQSIGDLIMQQDVYANFEKGVYRAPCSSLDYNFFSSRKERAIQCEDYFKESSLVHLDMEIGNPSKSYLREAMTSDDADFLMESLIDSVGLTNKERAIWHYSKTMGYTSREIGSLMGLGKSSVARELIKISSKLSETYAEAH